MAESYFRKAVETLTERNPNPYDGEPYYNWGWSCMMQQKWDEAYDAFFKSAWNAAWQDAAYYALAQLDTRKGKYESALDKIDRSLIRNWHNHKARQLKISILRKLGRKEEALALVAESLQIDRFNMGCRFEHYLLTRDVEVLVTVVPVQNKDFEWSTTGTFSLNSNKLISLSGSIFKSDYDYFNTGTVEYSGQVADSHRVQVGESIGNFYGFKVVDVDSEGRWIYEDRNGELVNYKDFTHAPEDKHVIGNGLPKWYAGWNNTLRYKNFDLNVTMRGAFGFQIINGGRMNYENVKNSRFENRLKSVNDLVFGKHTLSPEVEPEFNSYYVEDGDYWKIDNITLGYSFGQVGKYIKSLRVYGSVLNALTITGYKGIDPEVSTDGLTPGYDTRDRYPSVRSFTFGVNVKF